MITKPKTLITERQVRHAYKEAWTIQDKCNNSSKWASTCEMYALCSSCIVNLEATRVLQENFEKQCKDCSGSGYTKNGYDPFDSCHTCKGSGQKQVLLTKAEECTSCKGYGKVVGTSDDCFWCAAVGTSDDCFWCAAVGTSDDCHWCKGSGAKADQDKTLADYKKRAQHIIQEWLIEADENIPDHIKISFTSTHPMSEYECAMNIDNTQIEDKDHSHHITTISYKNICNYKDHINTVFGELYKSMAITAGDLLQRTLLSEAGIND